MPVVGHITVRAFVRSISYQIKKNKNVEGMIVKENSRNYLPDTLMSKDMVIEVAFVLEFPVAN